MDTLIIILKYSLNCKTFPYLLKGILWNIHPFGIPQENIDKLAKPFNTYDNSS